MKMDAWNPQEWFRFCQSLEKSAAINRVFVFPWYCRYSNAPNHWGFSCANPEVDNDTDIPLKFESFIGNWAQQVFQYLNKPGILPR